MKSPKTHDGRVTNQEENEMELTNQENNEIEFINHYKIVFQYRGPMEEKRVACRFELA